MVDARSLNDVLASLSLRWTQIWKQPCGPGIPRLASWCWMWSLDQTAVLMETWKQIYNDTHLRLQWQWIIFAVVSTILASSIPNRSRPRKTSGCSSATSSPTATSSRPHDQAATTWYNKRVSTSSRRKEKGATKAKKGKGKPLSSTSSSKGKGKNNNKGSYDKGKGKGPHSSSNSNNNWNNN